eukprot:jgi/Hompol1/1372/HPOL_005582-RA
MPKRISQRISKSTETPSVWESGFKSTFVSTNQADFTDKSKEVARRHRHGIELRDHVWFLGFEDADVLYRRKRFLEPTSVSQRKEVDSTPTASTHTIDYTVPGFNINEQKTPAQEGKIAGRPTPSDPTGFKYSSESLAKFTSVPRTHTKKQIGILLSPNEQFKRAGIQRFMDDLENEKEVRPRGFHSAEDRRIVHERVNAGLTITVAGK